MIYFPLAVWTFIAAIWAVAYGDWEAAFWCLVGTFASVLLLRWAMRPRVDAWYVTPTEEKYEQHK